MSLSKLSLYYHTLKYLRWEQLWFRLLYRCRAVVVQGVGEVPGVSSFSWDRVGSGEVSLFAFGKVKFLGLHGSVCEAEDWNDPDRAKLWLYNLHYFDDFNAAEYDARKDLHKEYVLRWIKENPPALGNGWEPYPTSLRLVNWVKWCSRTQPDDAILLSLLQQAEALSKQLEFHILGNHLFANAKALVFIGCYLQCPQSRQYLSLGLKLLDRELSEQFLSDGAHFELSPMYHEILLWDLLELIDLALLAKEPTLLERLPEWRAIAERALSWLVSMVHPDGEISFFNDAAFGIAAKPALILDYAQKLGLSVSESGGGGYTLAESGYSRVEWPSNVLFFDHARVGPDYLPGHAHADSLSIEWSVFGCRLLVNSGTSLYGSCAERLRQRKTAAHNTVVVDGADSSEVWGGFRVARRACSKLLFADFGGAEAVLKASHNGYYRLPEKVSHLRTLTSTPAELVVEDELLGVYDNAFVYFHLHPEVEVSSNADGVLLGLSGGRSVQVSALEPIVVEGSSWHPKFGQSIPSFRLVVPLLSSKSIVKFCLSAE